MSMEHEHEVLLHYKVKETELRDHLRGIHAMLRTAGKASWRSCVATHNEAHGDYAEVPDNERERNQGLRAQQKN